MSCLGHDAGVVLVHGVVSRLRQVPHEPEDGDPQGQGGQLVTLGLEGQQGVLQRLLRVGVGEGAL